MYVAGKGRAYGYLLLVTIYKCRNPSAVTPHLKTFAQLFGF